jgi:hypothetical protein
VSDHLPQWAQEMGPGYPEPTIVSTLGLLVAVAALLLALLSGLPATSAEEPATGARRSPACAELRRLKRHGVSSGPTLTRTRAACRREASDAR